MRVMTGLVSELTSFYQRYPMRARDGPALVYYVVIYAANAATIPLRHFGSMSISYDALKKAIHADNRLPELRDATAQVSTLKDSAARCKGVLPNKSLS